MVDSYLEKRREPRMPAEGRLTICPLDGTRLPAFEGRLMDLSHHGFRAAHDFRGLMPGQEVDFQHESGSGRARVVWNRILGPSVETGFFILHP
jgi:hypothetical protein